MAIVKTTRVERVLIVLAADGTLKGAHQEREEVIAEDGAVLSQRQLPPEPLTGDALAAVLPSQSALSSQVGSLQAALAEMTADRDAQARMASAAEAFGNDLSQRVSALEAQIAAMQGASPANLKAAS